MEVLEALRVLGAVPGSDWEDIRRAYREQLMAHHPDADGTTATGAQTEQIVEAFRVLRTLTDDGLKPLPLPFDVDEQDPTSPMILHARPGDVFVRLQQAADEIGHISYADRDANLLMVTIEGDDWAPAQLTAELQAEGSVTMVMFSLESLGVDPAPPIAEVVGRLAEELRAPAALD